MNEWLDLLLPFAAGLLLGLVFFGGLWLTVEKVAADGTPAIWFFLSLLTRLAIATAGFYLVAAGQLFRLLACLAGFVAWRTIMIRMLRTSRKNHPSPNGEGYDQS